MLFYKISFRPWVYPTNLQLNTQKKRKKKEKKRKKTGWCTEKKLKTKNLFHLYFLAYVIFMAQTAVILKPCSASLATPACVSLSNSTNDMSCFPGTRRTSLKPGNLEKRKKFLFIFIKITTKMIFWKFSWSLENNML